MITSVKPELSKSKAKDLQSCEPLILQLLHFGKKNRDSGKVVTGDKVKAGDPIAIIGNSSENLKLPHLHFELWYKGSSLDPQEYIRF